MTTLATSPQFPPPKRDIKTTLTLTESGANFVRVWCTAAPPGSELRKKLEKDARNRTLVHEGQGGANHPWLQQFDLGGRYTFKAQEYTKGASGYGGGYQRSPDGNPSEDQLGGESTLELFIGQRMTMRVGVAADAATLVLWVWNDTIRATTLAIHDEATPAFLSPTSAKASAATESASVAAALLALVGDLATAAIGNPGTILADLIGRYNAHLTQGGVHHANDSDNAMPLGLVSVGNGTKLGEALSDVALRLRYHYTNDPALAGVTAGRDKADYHDVGDKVNDDGNLPLVQGASVLADAYVMLADCCRSYEAHRVSTTVHDAADNTNALAALPQLMQTINTFLAVLASTTPTTPTTQSSGAMTMIARAGFAETPL